VTRQRTSSLVSSLTFEQFCNTEWLTIADAVTPAALDAILADIGAKQWEYTQVSEAPSRPSSPIQPLEEFETLILQEKAKP